MRQYTVVAPSRAKRSIWTNKRQAIRHAHKLARLVMGQTVSVYDSRQELIYQAHARLFIGPRVHIIVEEL